MIAAILGAIGLFLLGMVAPHRRPQGRGGRGPSVRARAVHGRAGPGHGLGRRGDGLSMSAVALPLVGVGALMRLPPLTPGSSKVEVPKLVY
jgi:hypothetical protein